MNGLARVALWMVACSGGGASTPDESMDGQPSVREQEPWWPEDALFAYEQAATTVFGEAEQRWWAFEHESDVIALESGAGARALITMEHEEHHEDHEPTRAYLCDVVPGGVSGMELCDTTFVVDGSRSYRFFDQAVYTTGDGAEAFMFWVKSLEYAYYGITVRADPGIVVIDSADRLWDLEWDRTTADEAGQRFSTATLLDAHGPEDLALAVSVAGTVEPYAHELRIYDVPPGGTLANGDHQAVIRWTGDDLDYARGLTDLHDFDGDGHGDLAFKQGSSSTSDPVRVFLGPLAGELSVEDAVATVHSGEYLLRLGQEISVPGDWDGDGHADLFLTSADEFDEHDNPVRAARAYLIRGPLEGTIDLSLDGPHGQEFYWDFAHPLDTPFYDIETTGDFDCDGQADLVASHPTFGTFHVDWGFLVDMGAVSVVSNRDNLLVDVYGDQSARWIYPAQDLAEQYFGYEVDLAGDVDQDGCDDYWISAPLLDRSNLNSGAFLLMNGRPPGE